jgi:pimeloyl-ACP methyl ester carboxylesterase
MTDISTTDSDPAPAPIETLPVGSDAALRAIAVRARRAGPSGRAKPGIVWLGGFRSDMEGTKAEDLDAFCSARGLAFTRFDYSGHGRSGGRFVDGTISRWLEEAMAVLDAYAPGPQIIVGSSMGGWLALRLLQVLAARGETGRIAGLLLLAPAPDFTEVLMEPELTDAQRKDLAEKGFFEEPTPYGPDANIFTRALFEDGRQNRVLNGIIATGCPVHIIQGMQDPDVPHDHALRLMEHLPADDVVLTLVRDGDHRLSRPADLAMIRSALANLLEQAPEA